MSPFGSVEVGDGARNVPTTKMKSNQLDRACRCAVGDGNMVRTNRSPSPYDLSSIDSRTPLFQTRTDDRKQPDLSTTRRSVVGTYYKIFVYSRSGKVEM